MSEREKRDAMVGEIGEGKEAVMIRVAVPNTRLIWKTNP